MGPFRDFQIDAILSCREYGEEVQRPEHERMGPPPLVKATNLHYGTLEIPIWIVERVYHNVDLWL
jgi:hypothetical protein